MEPQHDRKALPLGELMREAVTLHRAGNLDAAARLYRAVADADPRNVDALANLGAVCLQRGAPAEAVRWIDLALAISPRQPVALNNRGNALRSLRRHDEALASYGEAIVLDPGFAEAWYNRANAHYDLARLDAALADYERALALRPEHAGAVNNRANVLRDLGRLDEALACSERAVALRPDSAEVLNTRGSVLHAMGRRDAALQSYDRALALNAHDIRALVNRGSVLRELGRTDEALDCFDRAVALRPDDGDAAMGRGTVLHEQGRFDAALASCDRVLAMAPTNAAAHRNRGDVLRDLDRPDAALASYDAAIALNPDYAEACNNRGNVLRAANRLDEALASYRRARELKPDLAYLNGSILHTTMRMCDWSSYAADFDRVVRGIDAGMRAAVPFALLATPASPAQQQRCAEIHVRDRFPVAAAAPVPSARRAPDRIRIGYFSADFREHPVSYLSAELFALHDRTRFEVVGFSYDPLPEDATRRRVRGSFDHWFDVGAKSDREVAAIARDFSIDIAIDLGGHTAHSRLGILAHRAAPVQVHFLGYPGTTGAPFIDYLVADPIVVPETQRPFCTEKLIVLPETCQVNDRRVEVPVWTGSRRELGLPDAAFVFCCFNNSYKIEPTVFDAWMRILRRVGNGVLWLYADNPLVPANLRREAEARGVSGDRIVFAPQLPMPDHLARHRAADLFLDTFHFNAHTTASIALWAGLPVLTCPGESFISRIGASLLTAVGLPELIAHSHDDYEDIACDLATDSHRLDDVRQRLAAHRSTHPLFDTPRFARHLEDAYTRIQQRAAAGLSANHIRVDAMPAR